MALQVNWYKWALFGTIALVIFLYGRKCGRDSVKPATIKIVQNDTIIQPLTVIDTHYVPIKLYTRVRDIDTMVLTKKDTIQILGDYFSTKFYSDTAVVDHGTIVIEDSITQNEIAKRNLRIKLDIPIIKETKLIEPPKKNIWYFGFHASGSKKYWFHYMGADIGFKNKKDHVVSAGVSVGADNLILYGAAIKFPIRF